MREARKLLMPSKAVRAGAPARTELQAYTSSADWLEYFPTLVSSTARRSKCRHDSDTLRLPPATSNAGADSYAGGNPMHKRNAVQLRLALSAAAVCAVLAAASSSGAYRSGPLSIAMAGESGPILARSISTIGKPTFERLRASHRPFGMPLNDARICSALNGE